ncbi:MAG: CDP-alcohol phosphatidyltransferase family protein, partial [Limisphaerales bacterium]
MGNTLYRNLPNIVSILGVLPIGLLLLPDGHLFLIPLIIYNNIMDDLDGILAARLNLRSCYGAMLDNVCDIVSHTIFVLAIGMHFGGICAVAAAWAMVGLILRVVSRLDSPPVVPRGSPTNELVRHLLFVLLLVGIFEFPVSTVLVVVFVMNGLAMIVPFEMPHMIRSRTRSAAAIGGVNLALVTAWVIPATTAPIAAAFGLTFLYSFGT